jgi:hypothetical protein
LRALRGRFVPGVRRFSVRHPWSHMGSTARRVAPGRTPDCPRPKASPALCQPRKKAPAAGWAGGLGGPLLCLHPPGVGARAAARAGGVAACNPLQARKQLLPCFLSRVVSQTCPSQLSESIPHACVPQRMHVCLRATFRKQCYACHLWGAAPLSSNAAATPLYRALRPFPNSSPSRYPLSLRARLFVHPLHPFDQSSQVLSLRGCPLQHRRAYFVNSTGKFSPHQAYKQQWWRRRHRASPSFRCEGPTISTEVWRHLDH